MSEHKAKTCYLHIGAEKTGSTSIQAFLKANRAELADAGYLFPRSPGLDNQPALAAYTMGDCSRKNLLAQVGVSNGDQLEAFKKGFAARLKTEVSKASPKNIILSNEHCHSRIGTAEELGRLASLLLELAEEVRVIFYIRRQDQAATSLYSTALKVGQSRKKPDLRIAEELPLAFDYWRTCRLYEDTFGEGSVDVRVFDRSRLLGGDLMVDFRQATGLPEGRSWKQPKSQNQSLNRLGQRFLAAFNQNRLERFGPDAEHYRMALVRMLDKNFEGQGIKPSKQEAQDFLQQFKDGNEAIRQKYFPEHEAPLFIEDFAKYPDEEQSNWMPRPFMAFDAGARLFIEQQKEIDRLRAKIKALKADKGD
ncbi:MAG: hypothetical protein HWE08_07060 [Alphaproteobacteria bacterium]|nr:hypothetical protein [Alphaproteobacteria bacterium]